jgi:CBS domain containing-hemolysin-like protein
LNVYGIWIALVAALASCYVSAVYEALHHFSRSRLESLLQSRGKAGRLDLLGERHGYMLLTAVARAVLNLIILAAAVAWIAPPTAQTTWLHMLWAVLLAGGLIAVFGVTVAHSWGRHAPEPLLAGALPMLHISQLILRPIFAPLHFIDPLVRRLLGVPESLAQDAAGLEQEIRDVVSEGEMTGLVDEQQKHMIEAVVEFGETSADEIMTPRTDVIGIDADSSLEEVKALAREAGHSRFPVYGESLDEILGVLYVKDLLNLVGSATEDGAFDLRNVVRSAVFVPESKPLRDLLAEMQARKVHMAIVLDEYGGTAGLITIEDILEEIVGEIQDEYEPETNEKPEIAWADERTADIDGRAYIDDVNDALGLEIPEEEDYDTVGGFVFATLGHVPEVGESFDFANVRLTVTDAEKTRVNRVRIERLAVNGERSPAEAEAAARAG